MSRKDKLRDIDLMIESFVEEERYEDCALLVKIKNRIIKHYKKQKIKIIYLKVFKILCLVFKLEIKKTLKNS